MIEEEIKTGRKRLRLENYDYSNPDLYFITICTYKRINHFGDVFDGKMIPNETGNIVIKQWEWLSKQYNYIFLDEYSILPNHFHGIIAIIDSKRNGHDRSLQKIKSVSSLIGAFKTTSSKEIHLKTDVNFKWQKSFYDRVIRNENELKNIQAYIHYNPLKWQYDIENTNLSSDPERYKYYNKIINGNI
jgi:putative transposase